MLIRSIIDDGVVYVSDVVINVNDKHANDVVDDHTDSKIG